MAILGFLRWDFGYQGLRSRIQNAPSPSRKRSIIWASSDDLSMPVCGRLPMSLHLGTATACDLMLRLSNAGYNQVLMYSPCNILGVFDLPPLASSSRPTHAFTSNPAQLRRQPWPCVKGLVYSVLFCIHILNECFNLFPASPPRNYNSHTG